MPIFSNNSVSTQGSKPAKGFTLVEVLVVMLVIGLSLGAIFRIDYGSGPQQVENAASEFAGMAELILQEAVLGGDFWGIDFFIEETDEGIAYGYRWLRRDDEIWLHDMPAGMDEVLANQVLTEELTIELEIEGQSVNIDRKVDIQDSEKIPEGFSPDIWLYPSHETNAFSVKIANDENISRVIESDILGRIQIVALDNVP